MMRSESEPRSVVGIDLL